MKAFSSIVSVLKTALKYGGLLIVIVEIVQHATDKIEAYAVSKDQK